MTEHDTTGYQKTGGETPAPKPRSFKQVASDLWSLIVGLGVTGKNFTDSQLTVHYPRQNVDNLSTYRGHIELVSKPKDPFKPKCIICMMCVKVCPSNCISVKMKKAPKVPEGEEAPKKKPPKEVEKFHLDYNLCSLCGLCVQSCPVNSLQHSQNVYLAAENREAFEFDLLARMHAQARLAPEKEAPKKADKKADKVDLPEKAAKKDDSAKGIADEPPAETTKAKKKPDAGDS